MNSMPIALIIANRVAREEAGSALPHAPVVPHLESHADRVGLVQRSRKAVAGGLRAAADLIAPSRPVRHTPARAGVRGEAC
jgi:hypothetical protein